LAITLLVELIRWSRERRSDNRTASNTTMITHAGEADRTLG